MHMLKSNGQGGFANGWVSGQINIVKGDKVINLATESEAVNSAIGFLMESMRSGSLEHVHATKNAPDVLKATAKLPADSDVIFQLPTYNKVGELDYKNLKPVIIAKLGDIRKHAEAVIKHAEVNQKHFESLKIEVNDVPTLPAELMPAKSAGGKRGRGKSAVTELTF